MLACAQISKVKSPRLEKCIIFSPGREAGNNFHKEWMEGKLNGAEGEQKGWREAEIDYWESDILIIVKSSI